MSEIIKPTRRGLLAGLASLLAAPAIVKASSLMPISVQKPLLDGWTFVELPAEGLYQVGFDLEAWLIETTAKKWRADFAEYQRDYPPPAGILTPNLLKEGINAFERDREPLEYFSIKLTPRVYTLPERKG